MANKAAESFLKRLVSSFCNFKPMDDKIREYGEKLSKWWLRQEQWDRALEKMQADIQTEGLPALSVIYAYLKSVQDTTASGDGPHFLLFTLRGNRHAAGCADPRSPPKLPESSTDLHLAVSREAVEEDLIDKAEFDRRVQECADKLQWKDGVPF